MESTHVKLINHRTNVLYSTIFIFGLIAAVRLFYLQVVKYDYYRNQALLEHQAKFVIPASRGRIFALDGTNPTPLVLNETLKTVYVDPVGIDDFDNNDIATKLSQILNIDKQDIISKLNVEDSRYQVIKKKVDSPTAEEIDRLNLPGVGMVDETDRVYPQGKLASQILGFVNDEGNGQYGVEEFLNQDLKGVDGRYDAVVDVFGIPLTTEDSKILEQPRDGQDLTLTIDVNIQKFAEDALARGVKTAKSKSGSAIVMNPNTGAVLAMANYPTYNPAKYGQQKDFSVFSNKVVSEPYEAGSVIKVLTMSSALNEGVVTPTTTYFDKGYVVVDDRTIKNAEGGGLERTMTNVIQHSVNTGIVYALQQLGGGDINLQARNTLYNYFTNKFGLGVPSGLAQANEAGGVLFSPDDDQGNNVRYANMAFGQGMTATMLQMATAVSSIVNGGNYYQPHIVNSATDVSGEQRLVQPMILHENVISRETSKEIRGMMQTVVRGGGGYIAQRSGYTIGGKTGTAQVVDVKTGEYSDTEEIGSFVGYGGSILPEYVIMTRVDKPQIYGYAGSAAAAPIFADISNFMIDYYQIPPNNR